MSEKDRSVTSDGKEKDSILSRRKVLKTLTSGAAIATVPVATAKQQRTQEKTAYLDTAGATTLDEASVTQKDDQTYVIEMSGTVEPDSDAQQYTVSLRNERDGAQTSKATVGSPEARPAVSLQNASLKQTSPNSNTRNTDADGTVTTSEEQGASTSSSDKQVSSEVGTLNHDGSDSQSDYEGGAWIVSEDPVNLNVAKTQHWLDWQTSGGEVDYTRYAGRWKAWEYVAPPSDWNHNGSWFSSIDWSGNTAEQTYHVNYINWTWQWNDNKTEAFHRITLTANPYGSLDWETQHWHTGEDSGLLDAKAGHYSGYK